LPPRDAARRPIVARSKGNVETPRTKMKQRPRVQY
jgi:hypothetical protein